jgi:TRAP-type transport system periplasmic protein
MNYSSPVRRAFCPLSSWILVAGFLAAGFALTEAFPARSALAAGPGRAKYELKIATVAPDGSTWMNIMNDLDAAVRRQTSNDVGFRIYAGGIQGDEMVVLRKIRGGQLQGGGFTGVGLGEIAPSLRVLELPFLFRNEDEVRAVHQKMDPVFEQNLREAGFTLLGWAEVGFVYLYSKSPVTSTTELRNQKVWLWEGDPLAEAFLKAAGVSPVPLAITDVLTSLQTGLVTTVYITPLANIALQWFTRLSYVTDIPLTFSLGAVVVQNSAFDKIPPAEQAVVKDCCRIYFDKLRDATVADNAKSVEVIGKSGVKSVAPGPGEIESFNKIGEQVRHELVGKLYDQATLDQVTAALDAYRAASSTAPAGNKPPASGKNK